MSELLIKVKKAMGILTQELKRRPDDKEIANYLNVDLDKIQTILDISQAVTSLDTPVDDDGETSMGDLIPDNNSSSPLDNLIKEANSQIIDDVFNTIPEREAAILRMRFGINVEKPMTLEEVGNHYGLTRERIRQLENKAIRKLRNPIRANILKEAIN
jgi:RNA polymerase primary sigma factor